jgi:hypothetical protein
MRRIPDGIRCYVLVPRSETLVLQLFDETLVPDRGGEAPDYEREQ